MDQALKSQFPEGVSLQVILDNRVLFESQGKWLYPIFDLQDYLQVHEQDRSRLLVKDKIISKAAALLLIYLGIGQVYAELISKLGIEVFEKHHVPYSFKTCVPRITCQTEQILESIDNPQVAYQILCKRANRC